MRRENDREVPLEAIFDIARSPAHRIVWVRIYIAQLSGAVIVARDQSVIRAGEDDLRVFRRGRDPSRLAAADVEPIARRNSEIGSAAGYAHS